VVHALFLEGQDAPLVATVPVEVRRYLALSPARPQVAPCERIVRDLWGIEAMEARDSRPWLDHGMWGLTAPWAPRPGPASWPPEPPEFASTPADEAVGAFQLGIGPVQPLVSGPAHLRLTLDGERIRRLELLLGYAHRGVLRSMRDRTPSDAAPLAARIDAQTTVAHQSAFARAVEAACGWRITARAEALRAAMAELERIAVHLHHLGGTARAAGLDGVVPTLARLREAILVACGNTFGHRLMMGAIVPGGLARRPGEDGLIALPATLDRLDAAGPALHRALLGGLAERRLAGRARVPEAVAARCRLGGPAGRVSGQAGDWRLLLPPVRATAGLPSALPDATGHGDALARCRARLDEIATGLAIVRALLLADPTGPVLTEAPALPGPSAPAIEGIGVAGSAHGLVWHWVRLQNGILSALHVHDPSLPAWLTLEQAAIGLERHELPLLCASLGLSVAGTDQ
jgi:Ni,Fe-hydrogenase III large subunit